MDDLHLVFKFSLLPKQFDDAVDVQIHQLITCDCLFRAHNLQIFLQSVHFNSIGQSIDYFGEELDEGVFGDSYVQLLEDPD